MTVSGIDRLHSQLSKLEDMFPGYLTEIVEGSILMNPVRPFHGRTIQRVWAILEEQLPSGWAPGERRGLSVRRCQRVLPGHRGHPG